VKVGKEIRSHKKVTSNIISTAILESQKGISFFKLGMVTVLIAAIVMAPFQLQWSFAEANSAAAVWWPSEGARLSGVQPFKAALEGAAPEQYEMFWQVDGGTWNWMDNSTVDAPHKEVKVDLSGWSWRGEGPYKLNFIARQNGKVVAERAVNIYINAGESSSSASATEQSVPTAKTSVATSNALQASASSAVASPTEPTPALAYEQVEMRSEGNPLSGLNFYVQKYTPAQRQADEWRTSRPADAQKMDMLAQTPNAKWLGGWSGNVQETVEKAMSAAKAQGQTPIFIAYNIPGRDCGGYSAGGTSDYTNWIGSLARGIGSASAVVVLEPDALAGITCLSQGDQQKRLELLSGAVSVLKANTNTKVYLDAGHTGWVAADIMANRLQKANIARADGFALNVSNFNTTSDETQYGAQISSKVGGKHFVIDTSRNGSGSNGEWCNPWGRTIGLKPTTNTGNNLIDAYLWLKTPGESDGNCNGGPSAGVWWPEYALRLVR